MNLALLYRISFIILCLVQKVNPREELDPSIPLPHIQTTVLQFPCFGGHRVHDLSINWAKIPTALCPVLFGSFSSKRGRKNWLWGTEVTIGRTGKLQGYTKKKSSCLKERLQLLPESSETIATKMVGYSRLCRNALAHMLMEVEYHNGHLMIHKNPTLIEKVRGNGTTCMYGMLLL